MNCTNSHACCSRSQNSEVFHSMKVLYIGNGLTHYYNLVLSRLNSEPDVDLVVVVPNQRGANIGAGVYQTRDGINFKVVELKEVHKFRTYTTFKGLANVLRDERPDVVIVIETYLRAFVLDIAVAAAMKSIQAGLILKSIPFRYELYQDALRKIDEEPSDFASLPSLINSLIQKLGLYPWVKRRVLSMRRRLLNLPDAHVNYVEAIEYFSGYGVAREKIFVTRNSPDTELLFRARHEIETGPSVLPNNPYRLLHVGRLVQWKRVDMLLRAFALVKEQFPGAELLIIGTGPEEATLKDLANEFRISSSVSFLGGIYEPKILGQYYLASSLYVLAGMGGLSINEAMCFGLPILCSVCDGTEKVLVREGVNGRYFREDDHDDLVDKITWFFQNPEESMRMGFHSEEIIHKDVNIKTVVRGYIDALNFVSRRVRKI